MRKYAERVIVALPATGTLLRLAGVATNDLTIGDGRWLKSGHHGRREKLAMNFHIKLVLTALVAAAALAALVGSASANRLSATSKSLRVVWSSLEFVGPVTLRCRVTLEGSFHENTIVKTSGILAGYITAAVVSHPCTAGSVWAYNGTDRNEALGNATVPSTLPWHISYEGFTGTLPTPTAIRVLLQLSRFLARASFFGIPILCAYRADAVNGNVTGTANLGAGGRVTSLVASGRIRSETGGCPEGSFSSPAGDGTFTVLGTSNSVSITLI